MSYIFSFQVIQVASVSDQNDNIKDEMMGLEGRVSFLFYVTLFFLLVVFVDIVIIVLFCEQTKSLNKQKFKSFQLS